MLILAMPTSTSLKVFIAIQCDLAYVCENWNIKTHKVTAGFASLD